MSADDAKSHRAVATRLLAGVEVADTPAVSRAIEYARCSSLNIARRGEPFRWVHVDLVDPTAFDDTASAEFLTHCTEKALYDLLDGLQPAHATVSPEPPPPRAVEPPPPTTPRPRRDRS